MHRAVTGTPDPVVETHRVAALGTLRGMAVFGILLVNVNQLFEPVRIANSPLGLVHALFLYFADVLFIYAMAGALLFLMRRWPGRRLLVAGIGLWTGRWNGSGGGSPIGGRSSCGVPLPTDHVYFSRP